MAERIRKTAETIEIAFLPSDLAAATIASINPGMKKTIPKSPSTLNENFETTPYSVVITAPNATLKELKFFYSFALILTLTVGINIMMSARSASTAAPRAIHL